MKSLKSALLLAATLALTAVSPAAPFNFSYTFGDGTYVNGYFDGTANGAVVENLSNLSLFIDGTQVGGTVYTAQFDGADYVTGGVFSSNLSLANFLFINSDYAGGDFAFDAFFSVHQDEFGPVALVHSDVQGIDALETGTDIQTWALNPSAVPDAAPTAALLGLTTLGLLALHRRRS